jgi:hypothetical protein
MKNLINPKRLVSLGTFLLLLLIFIGSPAKSLAQDEKPEYMKKRVLPIIKWIYVPYCKCLEGNCMNGYSVYTFGKNCEHKFEGVMKKGRAVDGKYTWDNGKTWYEGKLVKGVSHDNTGKARMKRWDGTIIEGSFVDGTVTGKAKVYNPDGTVEEGEYDENSILNGYGTYKWTKGRYAGSAYAGNFKESRFNGYGEMNLSVDHSIKQEINKDEIDDKKNIIVWPYASSKNEYIGEWSENKYYGLGVYYSLSDSIIKSGRWIGGNKYIEMPEEIVLDSLNKKYGKDKKPRGQKMVKKKPEIPRINPSEIEEELNSINKENDSNSIVTNNVTYDDENEVGGDDPKIIIEWDIDTSFAITERQVEGNYPSGSYLYEEAPNVRMLLEAIHNDIKKNKQIKGYIENTDRIDIEIIATADKPNPNQRYNAEYGSEISGRYKKVNPNKQDFEGGTFYLKNFKENDRITKNETLAYIRAFGAQHYITTEIPEIPSEDEKKVFYHLKTIEYKDKVGKKYRKLKIKITIKLPKEIVTNNTPGFEIDSIEYEKYIPNGIKDDNSLAIIISNFEYKKNRFR